MKHFLILVFLCISSSISSQKISYTYKNATLQEIEQVNVDWNTYNKPIYKGLNNGIYWFKIELQKSNQKILSIPESHISRANLYFKGLEIKEKDNTRFITFKLTNHTEEKATYYLKVNCLLEARIPIEIKDLDTFYTDELDEFLVIGIYIGIVLCIILLNLFYFFSFKSYTYLYYVFMVIGMAANAFYKDGLSALIFGIQSFNETLEITINGIVAVAAIFFTTSYLSLKSYLPKVRKIGIIMVLVSFVFNIIYQITGNFTVFITTEILYLLALDVFWFTGVLLWNKSSYARVFTLAYGIPLFLVHDFYISPHLGFHCLNLPLNFYKVGSIFEMIVFTYAIIYQSKKMALENKEMREKLVNYTDGLKSRNLDISKKGTSTEELVEVYGFTLREIEVLKKVSSKETNKEIANQLFVSENTVKFHIRNILQKLEVKNRKAASKKYLKTKSTSL